MDRATLPRTVVNALPPWADPENDPTLFASTPGARQGQPSSQSGIAMMANMGAMASHTLPRIQSVGELNQSSITGSSSSKDGSESRFSGHDQDAPPREGSSSTVSMASSMTSSRPLPLSPSSTAASTVDWSIFKTMSAVSTLPTPFKSSSSAAGGYGNYQFNSLGAEDRNRPSVSSNLNGASSSTMSSVANVAHHWLNKRRQPSSAMAIEESLQALASPPPQPSAAHQQATLTSSAGPLPRRKLSDIFQKVPGASSASSSSASLLPNSNTMVVNNYTNGLGMNTTTTSVNDTTSNSNNNNNGASQAVPSLSTTLPTPLPGHLPSCHCTCRSAGGPLATPRSTLTGTSGRRRTSHFPFPETVELKRGYPTGTLESSHLPPIMTNWDDPDGKIIPGRKILQGTNTTFNLQSLKMMLNSPLFASILKTLVIVLAASLLAISLSSIMILVQSSNLPRLDSDNAVLFLTLILGGLTIVYSSINIFLECRRPPEGLDRSSSKPLRVIMSEIAVSILWAQVLSISIYIYIWTYGCSGESLTTSKTVEPFLSDPETMGRLCKRQGAMVGLEVILVLLLIIDFYTHLAQNFKFIRSVS